MMIEDDAVLVERFLRYHAGLFGAENIYLLDRGPTDDRVLRTLAAWERRGVHVDRSFAEPADAVHRDEMVADLIMTLDARQGYDFHALLDCDEFVVVRSGAGWSGDPAVVDAHLDTLLGRASIHGVSTSLSDVPGRQGAFRAVHRSRVIVRHDWIAFSAHGLRDGSTRNGETRRVAADVAHAHPEDRLQREVVALAPRPLALAAPPWKLELHPAPTVLGGQQGRDPPFGADHGTWHFEALLDRFAEIGEAAAEDADEVGDAGEVGTQAAGGIEACAADDLRGPTLGIGIVTRNRADTLQRTIEAIRRHTTSPHALVVADDGSTDGTAELLTDLRIARVLGSRRGVCWNRNRLLYFLTSVLDCDVVLLIEDDCRPVCAGWELPWIEAVRRFGHVNYAGDWLSHAFMGGDGSVADPIRSWAITDQCVGVGRTPVQRVGFLDARLSGDGHGQVDYASRLVGAGFGGERGAAPDGADVFWLIRSGLQIEAERVLRDGEEVGGKATVRDAADGEDCHRLAWRTDAEMTVFIAEMDEAQATLDGGRGEWPVGGGVPLAAAPGDAVVYFDEAAPGRVRGWAVDRARPGVPMFMRFFVSGEMIWEGVADGLRRDILEAGFGSDHAGFEATFSQPADGRVGILSARDAQGRALPVTRNDGRTSSRLVLRDRRADAPVTAETLVGEAAPGPFEPALDRHSGQEADARAAADADER